MDARLSIWSGYYHELSPEDAVERFIKNGIYCSELSSYFDEHGQTLMARDPDVVKTGKAFAKFINERNFEISQGHLWLNVIITKADELEQLLKWIDLYEAIGIKNMVLHCNRAGTVEENVASLKVIAEYIKDKDVTICIENLRLRVPSQQKTVLETADDLLNIINLVGSDKFGICLDTGHLNISSNKNQREFILKAGNKLKALHIDDNEGQSSDQHLMPYGRGTIKFDEVVKALREIDYHGHFNFELPGEANIPIELRDEKIKYIKACYDYLMNL